MPTRLCLHPRCPNPATYRGRCPSHAQAREKDTHPNKKIYNSRKWENTRKAVLFDQPLCPGVFGKPCGEIATDVHHLVDIQDGGDKWARSNLQGLCHECHSKLTRHGQSPR